jgi:hypothetical protein
MPTQVQFRRGTTTQNNNFTGAAGEISVDTEVKTIRVHDGSTAGGIAVAKADLSNTAAITASSTTTLTSKTFNLSSNTLSGTIALFNTALSDGDFATLSGVETLTNKTINGDNNTISNIGNASLTNSSITINGTSVSLGGTRTLNTDNVAEAGSPTNKYFTDARARAAVSVTDAGGDGSLSYNGATGVITYTGPSASEVRAHLAAGTGLTFTTGTFAIDSTVATLTGTQTFTNKTLTSPTLTTPILGTPSSGTLTSCTGLPIATGVSGLGTGVATFLATPTSANLISAITDETGTGTLVFSASPTFTGTVNAASLTLSGDLTVNGSTVTINSTTLTVDDKNIELGSVSSPSNATADGGGITLKGTTDKTFNWVDATNAWTSSEHVELASGKSVFLKGSSSGTITVSVPAVAGTNTFTIPAVTGTAVTTGDTGSVTNTMLAGSIANNKLTNSTISGVALGSNLNALTIGTGLSGTSYNGSSAVTIANTGVTSNVAGTGISVSGATGAVTITNSSPNATHTGDVTGATALTIADDAVTNAKAANMAANTIKGRITTGTGDPEDLTAANVRTIINVADGATANTGTVTSVGGTGTVNGITLTGTVTTSGNLTLGGTLSNVNLTSQVTGTLPVTNGGTGITSFGTGVATALGQNVTGSNGVVLATSPTLVTPTLGVASATSVALANGIIRSATLTTSATTANQVLDSIAIATFRSVKYQISITSGSAYHMTEVSVIHDGTTSYITEYGTILTGASLASFDADISSGNLRLLTTPVNAITTYKVMATAINV